MDIEKLEELPLRDKLPNKHDSRRWSKYRYNLPWKRLVNYFNSCIGTHIDKVISEFVKVDWILPMYRTIGTVTNHIELNTYMEGGEVYYFPCSGYCISQAKNVNDQMRPILYVHPTTKLVCKSKYNKVVSWYVQKQSELKKYLKVLGNYHQLLKIRGIWYEVKAVVDKSVYANFRPKFHPKDILIRSEEHPSVHYSNKMVKESNPIKIVLKHQLSKKELKSHNLQNGL